MSETRYIISDAAKIINVEPHVLRYWEEELGMDIPRNEMGHRYYTDKEVRLFSQVRDLKEKGFQLKAIKMILSTISEDMPASNIISLEKVRTGYGKDMPDGELPEAVPAPGNTEELSRPEDEPEEQTQLPRREMPDFPVKEPGPEESPELKTPGLQETREVSGPAPGNKMQQFKYIMDRILMEALEKNNQRLEEQVSGKILKEMDYMFRVQEEKDEERFRNLDEAIRKKQKGRKEAAAAKLPSYAGPGKKRRRLGRKELF